LRTLKTPWDISKTPNARSPAPSSSCAARGEEAMIPIAPWSAVRENLWVYRATRILFPIALAFTSVAAGAAEDVAIDRLLNKLPPPEKVVRPGMQLDVAFNDPLAKQMLEAAKARNFGRALTLSRRLTDRYPKSASAQCIRGMLAFSGHQLSESSAAFRRAVALQPQLVVAHVGLGMAEISQNHYASALSTFQRVTRLAPQDEVGWIASSRCAETLGRRQESLAFAKRGTGVAPSSLMAWVQLARAEKAMGHQQASRNALARANQLQRVAMRSAPRKR
jgi:tetratricopeptide (TPR) repeat protein